MKKIVDDIYSFIIKLPFPVTPELTVYYLDGENPAIIDTGLGDLISMDAISSELNEINRSIEDISVIINTHEHIEHFGGNQKIKNSSGASVIACSNAAPSIENFHEITLEIKRRFSSFKSSIYGSKMLENLMKFIDFHLTIEESRVEKRVEDGDIIDLGSIKLQVISTPGHADGHICLYDVDRKILFSGDHVISTGSTFVGYGLKELAMSNKNNIFNNMDDNPGNISLYIESIKKLQSLDLELILPGHGLPITDPYKKLEEEIGHKESREHIFLEILEKRKTVALDDLAAEAYNEEKSNFLQQGAALGYLEKISKSRKIEADLKGDKLYLKMDSI